MRMDVGLYMGITSGTPMNVRIQDPCSLGFKADSSSIGNTKSSFRAPALKTSTELPSLGAGNLLAKAPVADWPTEEGSQGCPRRAVRCVHVRLWYC